MFRDLEPTGTANVLPVIRHHEIMTVVVPLLNCVNHIFLFDEN